MFYVKCIETYHYLCYAGMVIKSNNINIFIIIRYVFLAKGPHLNYYSTVSNKKVRCSIDFLYIT